MQPGQLFSTYLDDQVHLLPVCVHDTVHAALRTSWSACLGSLQAALWLGWLDSNRALLPST